jgi:hypothetical protein
MTFFNTSDLKKIDEMGKRDFILDKFTEIVTSGKGAISPQISISLI